MKNDTISGQTPSTNHDKKEQKLCTNMLEHIEGLRMISEWSVVLSVSPRYSYLSVS